MSFVASVIQKKIGGAKDSLALNSVAASVLTTTPYLSGLPNALPTTLAAAGASFLTWRYLSYFRDAAHLNTGLKFHSDKNPMKIALEQGWKTGSYPMLLGYTSDSGQPVEIPEDDVMRHLFCLGQSGVGKTVMLRFLFAQQMQRGGGLLFIDGKLNSGDIKDFYDLCCMYGRQNDLYIINPGNPELSNTYNPILYGDPDEVSSRILSLIPSTAESAGADYFKQAANQGIATLIAALQATKLAYNMIDICVLLMNPRALEELEKKVSIQSPNSSASKALSLFLDQFRVPNPQNGGMSQIDIKKMKDVFGGIGGRLYLFGTNKFGQVCNTYSPEVDLFEAIRANKIIYIALPTMSKDIAAQSFAKMVIGDLRSTIARMQDVPESEKPDPPFFCGFDEAGSYASDSWPRIYEQSRSAKIFCLPACQTTANFKAISDELYEMVCGNTWTKIFFKIGTQLSAEEAAELIGYKIGTIKSLSDTSSDSISAPMVGLTPAAGLGDSQGTAYGERQQEEHKVKVDELKSLAKGQCVVLWAGKYIYDVQVPMILVDKKWSKRFGKVKVNHKREAQVYGCDFFKNSDKYLSKNDKEEFRRKNNEINANSES